MPARQYVIWPQGGPVPPPLIVGVLQTGEVGVAYFAPLAARGGIQPYTWSIVSASPNTGSWVSIGSDGVLRGTPTTAETESIQVEVTDRLGHSSVSQFSCTILPAVAITTSSLPEAMVGAPYAGSMAATGGQPPYVWSLLDAAPDTGNWLGCAPDGSLFGTPGAAESESVRIKVTDAFGASSTQTLPITVLPPLTVTTSSLPAATAGTAYSTGLAASGGQPPYAWVLVSASPDAGAWLKCSPSGVLSGTPGAAETEAVVVGVTDALGNQSTQSLSLTVLAALSITTTSLPGATVGSAYSFSMAASGGVSPYAWSIVSDTPDTGAWLSISSAGVLSGTPGTAETESVLIKAADSALNTAQGTFSLQVTGGAFDWANAPFPRSAGTYAGGTQTYGWVSGSQNYPTVNTDVLARFQIVHLGGSYEHWSDTGRDKELLVTSIKGGTGHGRPKSSVGTLVFLYQLLGQQLQCSPLVASSLGGSVTPNANDANPTFTAQVGAWNWWAYVAGPTQPNHYVATLAQGSSPDVDAFGLSPILYTYDYTNGKPWAGTNSNGEGPYEFGAKYAVIKLLSKNRTFDARFSGLNAKLGSPSADGVFYDNVFRFPQESDGYSFDANRSGSTSAQGFDGTTADYLSAGDAIKYAQQQVTAAALGRARTYNIGNFSDYTRSVGAGVSPYSMDQVLDGGLLESFFGFNSSPDLFSTMGNLIAWAQRAIAVCKSPKVVYIGCRWPSAQPRVPLVGKFPNTSLTVGSTSYYQYFRYCAAFCAVQGAWCGWNAQANGYGAADSSNGSLIEWFDEYDNAAATSGWLGQPVAGATGVAGGYVIASGVYAREFDNGLVLWNPGDNVVATLTASQLGGSGKWKHISGPQCPSVNDGTLVTSSITLGNKDGSGSSRDGLFLVRA